MATRPPSRLRRDLRLITGDGISVALMIGLGEANLAAFALALGFSEVKAGLLTTLPLLAGSVIQLITPRAVKRVGSLKRWVTGCVFAQAFALLPLTIAALVGAIPGALLVMLASLYWAAGMSAGPPWNTWVGTIIPERIRARYFGMRSRLLQMGVVIGLAITGVVLELGDRHDSEMLGFAVIFALAMGARLFSGQLMIRQSEAPRPVDNHRVVPFSELAKRFRHGRDAQLLLFLVLVQVAGQIAIPFFTPYLLNELGLPYGQFMMLLAASFAGKMIALPWLGRLAQRIGAHRVMMFGSLAVTPLSVLWLGSEAFPYLLGLQLIGGIGWGAFELGAALMFFEALDEEERTSLLTLFNFANCVALVGGSLIGGAILRGFDSGLAGYTAIFVISAFLRLCTLPLARRMPSSVPKERMVLRPLTVRPSSGSIDRPVVVAHEK